MATILFIISSLVFTSCQAHQIYQKQIPNGDAGEQPGTGLSCGPLGHNNCTSGDPRNQFGIDFARLGREWNEELCNLDSDGDGLTNGQELGDPCCKWTPTNNFKLRVTMLSHPGLSSSTNNAPSIVCGPSPVPRAPPPKSGQSPPPPNPTKLCSMTDIDENRLKCGRILTTKIGISGADNGISVKVNLKKSYFKFILRTSKSELNISKYSMAVSTDRNMMAGMDGADMLTLTEEFKKPKSKVRRTYDRQSILDMELPDSEESCCGKKVVFIMLDIRYCDNGVCDRSVNTFPANIQCGAICDDENGVATAMSKTVDCPSCST